jgi:HD-like signal output (HDOD) protein
MTEAKQCATCGRVYRTERDYLTDTSRWRMCSQGNLWFNCSCASTLMIKKGKFDWYSPDRFMGDEAKTVFNRLGGLKELPHIPTSVMEIIQLLQNPDVSPKEVAKAVRREPVVASQILQIAENIRTSRNPTTPKMHALEHAIVYVGFKALSDLVLTSALKGMPLPASAFRPGDFWQESYLTGSIAEFLMKRFSLEMNPDEAFLAGSLCNVGKLVQALVHPDHVNLITRAITDGKAPITWRKAEQKHDDNDHSILGEVASSMWGFPVFILQAARRHHELPIGKPGKPLDIYELAAVANQFLHWVMLRPHRMEYEIITAFARRTGLTEKQLDEIARELTSIKDQLLAEAPH